MEKYMIIVKVCGVKYCVKVSADDLATAKQYIYDLAINATYLLDSVQVFARYEISTEYFAFQLLDSQLVSIEELTSIIRFCQCSCS